MVERFSEHKNNLIIQQKNLGNELDKTFQILKKKIIEREVINV